jgi:hypothetical protein
MERAPHDFGGHKAAAIRDSQTALVELRAALAYRAQKDSLAGALTLLFALLARAAGEGRTQMVGQP